MYDTYSVDKFTLTFKREDFLNIKECKHKLSKWGFYSDYERGVYVNKIGIYISVKSLINRCADIPTEYYPISVKFDTTVFISKISFSKTLKWLHNEDKRLHPKTPKDFIMEKTTKGGSRVNHFGRKKPKFKKNRVTNLVAPFSDNRVKKER